jgi:histidinol-phosphate aminotransferase
MLAPGEGPADNGGHRGGPSKIRHEFEEEAMSEGTLSRRRFAQTIGAALGAAVVAPDFTKSLGALAAPRLPGGSAGEWIELNSNENPYGPSPKALEAITRSERVASRYPDAKEGRVIEAIAKLHGVQPANVLLGCGSGEILRVADMAFLGPDKFAVAAEPTFEAVLAFARVARSDGVKVPVTADFRHDLRAMATAGGDKAGLIYICNPNNPTGTIVTKDEMSDFFQRAPKHAIILVDEAYHHFVDNPKYASAFEWFGKVPNLVIARTFSKVYGMAGMRLGYAVASPELIRAMSQHKLWSGTNAAVLEAALASLDDQAHVADQKRRLNGTRQWLCKELERDGRRYIPSEANFVMFDVGGDVQPLIRRFQEKKILVGRKFPSMGNWMRITVGTPKEMEAFIVALREIVPVKSARAA